MSQNRIVLSSPELIRTFPSGDTVGERTQPFVSAQDAEFVHGRHFKNRMVLSWLPVIRILASGVKVIAPIQNSIGFEIRRHPR